MPATRPAGTEETNCLVVIGTDEFNPEGTFVALPEGWNRFVRERRNLFEIEVLFVATESYLDDNCVTALVTYEPGTEVSIRVVEDRTAHFEIDAQSTFTPFSEFSLESSPREQCDGSPPTRQVIAFNDRGRSFTAVLTFGAHASPERRSEAYAILNSLMVAPIQDLANPSRFPHYLEDRPEQHPYPPRYVVVFVIDATGLEGAGEVQMYELRGVGYYANGVAEVERRALGTTVACRDGFEREVKAISKVVDGSTVVSDITEIGTSTFADCVVTIGRS